MARIFSIALLYFITSRFCHAQLPNNNMYLISNVNQHSSAGLYSAIWGYKAPNGREYAILGCFNGTAFIDVTNPANIQQVGFVPSTNPSSGNNQWREMKTYLHYAYIVSEVPNSGIQIVDLSYLPDSVRYLKRYVPAGHTSTHSISQSGPYLYLNGCNSSFGQGVNVIDLSTDPENPVKRGGYNSVYIHDCRVRNDTIYSANIFNGTVSIVNAVNKNSLSHITTFTNLPGAGPHNTALSEDGRYLFVTDEIGSAPYMLKVWDISNLGNISFLASWQPTGITTSIIHNVETYGSYLLAGHYSAGVRMVDISNPATPIEVAWYDTYPANNNQSYNGCWGVYMFPSGKIIASDRQTGLYVLKTTYNVTLAVEGFYNSSVNRHSMRDTVRAYLRSSSPPFAIMDSSKAILDSVTLTAKFGFSYAPTGTYYISIKHRNSLETWSKAGGQPYNPMKFEGYNFAVSAGQAYGNNMVQVDAAPVRFALYSGDVDNDGAIDGSDAQLVDNDAAFYLSGYLVTDLNGDSSVDGSDMVFVDNNAASYITKQVP